MKEVKYNIIKYGKYKSYKFSGYGKLNGNDLITEYTDKYGELVKHTYEDCMSYLHPVLNQPNEYKGGYSEDEHIVYEDNNHRIHEYDTEVDYNIWIKILD